MAHGRLLVDGIWIKKRFLSKDIAAVNQIARSLLILIAQAHHQGPVQDEIDLRNLTTLLVQLPTLDHFDYLGAFDHILVRVERDLRQDPVVQPHLLQAEHLQIVFSRLDCLLKLSHEVAHVVLSISFLVLLNFIIKGGYGSLR